MSAGFASAPWRWIHPAYDHTQYVLSLLILALHMFVSPRVSISGKKQGDNYNRK